MGGRPAAERPETGPDSIADGPFRSGRNIR